MPVYYVRSHLLKSEFPTSENSEQLSENSDKPKFC